MLKIDDNLRIKKILYSEINYQGVIVIYKYYEKKNCHHR